MLPPRFILPLALAAPLPALGSEIDCSPRPSPELGVSAFVSGPEPRFGGPAPTVIDSGGRVRPLVRATPPEGLEGLELPWYRPTEPLETGVYRVDDQDLEVRTTDPESPPLSASARLRLDGILVTAGSCLSLFGDPECGEAPPFYLSDSELRADGRYLITLETFEGAASQHLVRQAGGTPDRLLMELTGLVPEGVDPALTSVCVTVAGVSGEGVLGPVTDLGCTSTDPTGPGCAGGNRPGSLAALVVLVLGTGLARLRSRLV